MPQDKGFEAITVVVVLIVFITVRMTARAKSLRNNLIDTSLCSFSNFRASYRASRSQE